MWVWLEALSEDESINRGEKHVSTRFDQLARLDASRALGVIDRILENVPEDREEGRRLTTSRLWRILTHMVCVAEQARCEDVGRQDHVEHRETCKARPAACPSLLRIL